MFYRQVFTGFGESLGDVTGAVDRHDAGDLDAEAFVVGDRRSQKVDSADGLFVRLDLGESNPRMIVDEDMDEFPPNAATVALSRAIAGDPVADAVGAAKFIDVDMDHLAGMLALVAYDFCWRFEIPHPAQARAPQNPTDSRRSDARRLGNMAPGEALASQRG